MTTQNASALIGHTGFVGGTLLRSRSFSEVYNSRNIQDIRDRSFDLVICAGAPASMWAANQDPDGDRARLGALAACLETVSAGRLVLISTIAVLDDLSAGYTESRAGYETAKAYGRNRRELEERLQANFPHIHVLRLPALFGMGLKKNFVFDLLNPMPTFIRPDRFWELAGTIGEPLAASLTGFYRLDAGLNMMALDRGALDRSPEREVLTDAVKGAGMHAAMFTNSRSLFQYYDLARLADDIDRMIAGGIELLNVCSEPIEASEIHSALTGAPFENGLPPLVREDVRSEHASLFGGTGPYLFSREDTLGRLQAFYRTEVAR